MTPLSDYAWESLLRAELATAEEPVSAASFRRVAAAFEEGRFPEVTLAVLRKTTSFGIEQHTMLPALLSGCRKLRQFTELNVAAQAALSIVPRDAGLRRELALALSSLGQTQAADLEWALLIRAGEMTETDWLNCAQSIATGVDAPAFEQTMKALAKHSELRSSHAAAYCAARHLVDRNMTAALEVLRNIDPAGLPDSDVQLDLAILAFRLREYARAEEAATLAASTARDTSFVKRILATIHSFAGDPSGLRKVSLPIPSTAEVLVSAHTLTVKRNATAWGFVHRDGAKPLQAHLLELTAEPEMIVPEGIEPAATFSVLSERLNIDLFHILCGVDWSWPHFMLQRRPEGDLLHCLIEATGHRFWQWEEVNPELQSAADDPTRAPGHPVSTTWIEARRELAEATEDEP